MCMWGPKPFGINSTFHSATNQLDYIDGVITFIKGVQRIIQPLYMWIKVNSTKDFYPASKTHAQKKGRVVKNIKINTTA